VAWRPGWTLLLTTGAGSGCLYSFLGLNPSAQYDGDTNTQQTDCYGSKRLFGS
jgi:hypothetical protein